MIIVALVTGLVFIFKGQLFSYFSYFSGIICFNSLFGAMLVTIPVVLIGLFNGGSILIFTFFNKLYCNSSIRWQRAYAVAVRKRSKAPSSFNYYSGFDLWRNLGFWGLLLAIPIATFLRAILIAWPTKEDLLANLLKIVPLQRPLTLPFSTFL